MLGEASRSPGTGNTINPENLSGELQGGGVRIVNDIQPKRGDPTPTGTLSEVRLIALPGVPMVAPGDDVAAIILGALKASGDRLETGDVVVIAQKIVSKAEDRFVDLESVAPSQAAIALARITAKDPRLVELILRESEEVVAARKDALIVAHRLGFVLANAGIDHSNVGGKPGHVLLLPVDPDGTAARIRADLERMCGAEIAVVINDSIGRAWRNGSIGMAIGASGLPALLDLRGHADLDGRALEVTEVGLADELASAASLVMGQASEGRPVVIVRGLALPRGEGRATDLVRPKQRDLFR
jgi:coenzyme F420-0:L-glutamate ligase / coenzyme F420-1:gamma-L-glutamate ligase